MNRKDLEKKRGHRGKTTRKQRGRKWVGASAVVPSSRERNLFFFLMFYIFLREGERAHGLGAGRERERESQPDSTLSVQSPMWSSNS